MVMVKNLLCDTTHGALGAIQILRNPLRGGGVQSNITLAYGGRGDRPKYYLLTEGGVRQNGPCE